MNTHNKIIIMALVSLFVVGQSDLCAQVRAARAQEKIWFASEVARARDIARAQEAARIAREKERVARERARIAQESLHAELVQLAHENRLKALLADRYGKTKRAQEEAKSYRAHARAQGAARAEDAARMSRDVARVVKEIAQADLVGLAEYSKSQLLMVAPQAFFGDADGVVRPESIDRRLKVHEKILLGRALQLSDHDIADYRAIVCCYCYGRIREGYTVPYFYRVSAPAVATPVAPAPVLTYGQYARACVSGTARLLKGAGSSIWSRLPNMPRFGCNCRRASHAALAVYHAHTAATSSDVGSIGFFSAASVAHAYQAIKGS